MLTSLTVYWTGHQPWLYRGTGTPLRTGLVLWRAQAKIMGKKTLEAAQILIDDSGLQGVLSPAEFVAKRDVILENLFPTSELLPGAFPSLAVHTVGSPYP